MIHLLLKICLAFVILSCPLRCQLGLSACNCQEQGTVGLVVDQCCPCTTPETPTHSNPSSSSVPESDGPCSQCQCICAGATLPDSVDLDHDNLWESVCFGEDALMFAWSQIAAANNPPPPKWMHQAIERSPNNIGRANRVLFMSFVQ